ncbi:nucleocapsid protein [Maple mottle-associated virus]|uniref:Nucleocapsid protein n=1 Tax=Maple mottle-associated virus TaxID=2778521 RepID=A0A7L8Y9A7_9VIRU|nr:nucleocapsid protein [Maple mottle-associated virus]QOI17317.1 nucleocapsid protein [Maple mottle-associated virus]
MANDKKRTESFTTGFGSKMKTFKIQTVDGILVDPKNSELKAEDVPPVAFTSRTMNVSRFSMFAYREYCSVTAVVAYLSQTKDLKDKLQKGNITLSVSNGYKLVIAKDLGDCNVENVVSFNKACAIMAAGVLKHTLAELYDWRSYTYKPTDAKKVVAVDTTVVNRLAGQMGMKSEDPYYWFIVPGYEFLYELYPAETIAYTLIRLQYRRQLNIPDSMTDVDIISSLMMKMNRMHNFEVENMDSTFRLIDVARVEKVFVHLSQNIGTTNKTRRNDEAVIRFKELIKKFMPAVQASKIGTDAD